MKVLHVAYTWHPDPVGGTEVYVEGLCRELDRHGIASEVAAPWAGERRGRSEGPLPVHRFATTTSPNLSTLYGGGDAQAAEAFARILDDVRPDVVHQHAFSPACSVRLVRTAAARRVPVVFSFHSPTVTCQRGTMLQFGRTECEGIWDARICTPCVLDGLGLAPGARLLARAGAFVAGPALARSGWQGGALTALQIPQLMRLRTAATRELFALVDRVVSLSPWTTTLLLRNGVDRARIVYSPHGVGHRRSGATNGEPRRLPLRLVHLGRTDRAKGTALLLQALALAPELPVEVDLFLVGPPEAMPVPADSRVRRHGAIPHAEVIDRLSRYDAVLVPSQGLETGPLVVLEALTAGIPVIGSRIGGLRDRVRDGADGWLVEPFDDPAAWARVLRELAARPETVWQRRDRVRQPRSMAEVADEMADLYGELVRERRQ